MRIECEFPTNCPICNQRIEIKEKANYCSHVAFVYVWGEADSFVYVKKDFAEKYIDKLQQSKEHKEFVKENGCDIGEQLEDIFKTGKFEPFNEDVVQIPYFENIALNACSSQAKLYFDERYYSGAIVCIDIK